MSAYAKALVANANAELELARVLCEWDQPEGTCRCAGLAADDEARCKSPIGIARVLQAKFYIQPIRSTPATADKGEG